MPTYKNTSPRELVLATQYNPRSSVPRSISIAPGKYFVTHSSEVPVHWLEAEEEGGEPRVVKVSDAPTDQELFG